MSTPDAGLSRQAFRLYQSGYYAQAEPLFERLAGEDPTNWQYPLVLGLCRQAQGDFQAARSRLEQAVELGDAQPAPHYHLGRLLTDLRQPGAAREQYAQAIALDPNHVDARTGMGLVSLMVGDFERAVSELKTALRAGPNHVPALAALARALIELQRFEEAAPYASKAVERDPQNAAALDVAGRVFLGAGQLDSAEECFRSAIKIKPDSGEINAGLAQLLRLKQRDAEALKHYIKALERNIGGPAVVIETTICLERLGDLSQAARLLLQADARWPETLELGLRLAEVRLLQGRPADAQAQLERMRADHPGVQTMRARVLDAQGDAEAARELLQRVVDADADFEQHEARMLLARLRSEQHPDDPQTARAPIAGLLDRDVPLHDAVLVWSTICERAGDFGQASAALQGLLDAGTVGETDRALLHARLANCHDRAGERSLAWAHWRKGGWRPAPNLARLEDQRRSGMLARWLDDELPEFPAEPLDDGRRAPLIVAGWPGSVRDPALAALAAHSDVYVLDPQAEPRRLESLHLPIAPADLARLDEAAVRIGRRRYLRDASATGDVARLLDPGWWQASSIPALARFFPDAVVLVCDDDPADLAVQWRIMGLRDPDRLLQDYLQERKLWQRLRDALPCKLIPIARGALIDDPEPTLAAIFETLGLAAEPAAIEAATAVIARQALIPAGYGNYYKADRGGE